METILDLVKDSIINHNERYLLELEEKASSESDKKIIGDMITLYLLGRVDIHIDLYEIEPKNRIKFIQIEPS